MALLVHQDPPSASGIELHSQAKGGFAPGRAREYRTIQALRFLAALMVVILHATFYTAERLQASTPLYKQGGNGVGLFFVISGFVMIMSSRKLEGARGGWSAFAMKRIVRIVPLYWLITTFKLATLLLAPAVVLHATLDWGYVAKSYLFIPAGNVDGYARPLHGVGWTLNYEMFFYALFALALALRVRPILFLTPILVGLSLLMLVRTPSWPVPLQFLADAIVLYFLAGMLIARWCQAGRLLPSAVAGLVAAIGLAYLFVPMGPRPEYGTMLSYLVAACAAGAVVYGTVSLETQLGRYVPRIVLFGGGASYSLYLVHPIISPIVPELLARLGLIMAELAVVGSVAIALLGGALCYVFVENPLTRALNMWVRQYGLFDFASTDRNSDYNGDAMNDRKDKS